MEAIEIGIHYQISLIVEAPSWNLSTYDIFFLLFNQNLHRSYLMFFR